MTWTFVGIGAVAGIFAGMFGVGGGVIIVPLLVLVAGMSHKVATGTSIGVFVFPVVILGAISHYRAGNMNVRASMLLAAGLVVGSLLGAQLSLGLSELALKRAFAVALAAVAVRLWVTV